MRASRGPRKSRADEQERRARLGASFWHGAFRFYGTWCGGIPLPTLGGNSSFALSCAASSGAKSSQERV
jgi:hypothetical protein